MSDGRKRLSGAEYRKRKLEKEKNIRQVTTNITKFFTPTPSTSAMPSAESPNKSSKLSDTTEDHNVEEQEVYQITENPDELCLKSPSPPQEYCESDSSLPEDIEGISEFSDKHFRESISHDLQQESDIDLSDPAKWPKIITDPVRMSLIDTGPIQCLDVNFPKDHNNRSFSTLYFSKKISNGEKIYRNWLVYSKSINSVFCFCCKIFCNITSSAFSNDGYSEWQHLSRNLERHEKSKEHFRCFKSWMDLKKSLKYERTVDAINETLINLEKKRWKAVIERIVYVIKFLARQNLAFRGHSNKLYESNNGNFLKLMETIAQFDNIIAEHIGRIQHDSARMPHYLGDKIQNEIISLIGEKIKANIISLLKYSKYYSIILDCTPDISHVEQITIIVRFVYLNNTSKKVEIREHFLGFCPILDTTGEGLTTFLINFLNRENIDIHDMRGQGYDNGSNMKGRHNGLQKRILDLNPRAFYVPCAAHSLNLVINDAAKSSLEIENFFSIVQEIYVFFSASTYRWHILKKECPSLTVKPLSDTRWESRIDAIRVLRYNLETVYDALYNLFDDASRDANTRNLSKSLLTKIKSFKFICSIVIWYNILTKINIVNKAMQKSDMVLPKISEMLKQVNNYLKECRSDNSFETILAEAATTAKEIDCETTFPKVGTIRPRKKKALFLYENADETIDEPKHHYKINFYFTILDTAISKIEERFDLLNAHNESFGFLNDIYSLMSVDRKTKMKYCADLQIKLSDPTKKENDINALDLCDEIENLAPYITETKNMNASTVLDYLFSHDLHNLFPNITVALRIFLSIPVTVASGERSFSKLRLIKNYLRSTMSQERLSNLSIISIESQSVDELNISDIVDHFAVKRSRLK